jgi:L-arginine dehydrogenase
MSPSALVLDAAAVERRLPGGAAVRAALRRAFAELAGGTASQPPQVQLCLPDGGGDVIVYPGTLSGPRVAGVKASPYLTARPVGERVTAWTLLLSTEDGHPVLLCDSARLTVERTAGTTAVAVDALAPADAGTLAVVGAGPVALAHLRHVGDVRAWRRVVVSSPALAAGDPARLAALQALPVEVEVAPDAATTVRDADVVCLCTSAAQPVLDLADTREDALVTSLSTNAAGAHEVAPEDVARCAVYVDSRAGAPLSAGELRPLVEDGRVEVVADLPELVTGTAPPRPPGRAFFRSVGLGIEDLAVAALLIDPGTEPA